MNKLSDLMPKTTLYEGVDRKKPEEFMNKMFVIKEVTPMVGEHGEYYVCLCELNKHECTTAFGSKVVNDKLRQLAAKKGNFPVEVKLVERKSKEGRVYQDLE